MRGVNTNPNRVRVAHDCPAGSAQPETRCSGSRSSARLPGMMILNPISTGSGACVRSSARQRLDLNLDAPHRAIGAPGSDLARSGVKGGSAERVRTRAGLPDLPSAVDPDELLGWGQGYSAETSLPSDNASTLSDCRVRTASTAVSHVYCLTSRDCPLSMSPTIFTSSPRSEPRSEPKR